MSDQRQAPFYCPYCADEDLIPAGTVGWTCRSCLRIFELRHVGIARSPQEVDT